MSGDAPARGGADFWHGPVAVDSLCLYRAGFGALLCLETLRWLPHTTELFSSAGFHLGEMAARAPAPPIAFLLTVILLGSSAMVTLGWQTRIALGATLGIRFFFYELDHINEKTIDSIVLVLCVILLISACDARWSVDDWLRRRQGLPRRPALACAFPLRLLQLEFAQVYFFAGVSKMVIPDWVNGTVFINTLSSRWATELGVWTAAHLPDVVLRMFALGTILYELLAGFLLFVPWARPFVIAAGLLLHLGIEAAFTVGTLGLHFACALLLLFPEPETVARVAERVAEAWPRRPAGAVARAR